MRNFAAALIFLAGPVLAQSPAESAADAAARLAQAQTSLAMADSARDRIKALTETVQAYETGLAVLRDSLRQAAVVEAENAAALGAARAELAQLIVALQAIGRTPAPAQMTHPGGPVAALRAGMIASDIAPSLRAQAAEASAKADALAQVRALQETAVMTLSEGLLGAQTARAALGQAMSQRRDLPRRFDEDPIQTALLLASFDTLAGFADTLAGSAPTPDSALTATGDLSLPVTGISEAASNGLPGIAIRTAPRALVTAPAPATILFRGPLLDYGNVIILEPAPDVLFILAGLEEIFGETGEIVQTGAPLGLMGADVTDQKTQIAGTVDGILNQLDEDSAYEKEQTLYLEVRDGQTASDPGRWFALD